MSGLDIRPRSAAASAEDLESPMAAIRRRQQQLVAETEKDFDVPGYGGALVARYRRLEIEESNEQLLGPGADWERNAAFLDEACIGIYRRDDAGKLQPAWDGERPAVSVSDAPQYAEMNDIFGLKLHRAVDIVLAVVGGNQFVLCEHGDDVYRWMRSVTEPGTNLLGG